MAVTLLDYTSKAIVSLDRDRCQKVSVTISLRELPELIPNVARWPDVFVATHLLSDMATPIDEISEPSKVGTLESTLGSIYSEIRIACAQRDLKMIGINIWDFKENVSDRPVTAYYMRNAAYHTAMVALFGVDVFARFNRAMRDRNKRCGEFSLHALEIKKVDNLMEQSSNLVDFRELVRAEKESRSK